jgi:MAD (mothers against decapentaplegic) family protein 1
VVSSKSLNQNQIEIDCSQEKCFYALCWDAKKYPFTLVTRMPRFVPVPVDAPNSLTLFRGKRDFGISAIIVGLVATVTVAASVTASALALYTSVQTTQTINELSMMITTALDKQATANLQIQGGLMLINQGINLVQEQVDSLWQLAQLGCEYKMPGLCVTSVQYENFTRAANLSKALSRYMLQNWTMEFEQTLQELRVAILQVNYMRLDLSLTKGFSTWISSAFSYFKEWVGVGLFAVIIGDGAFLFLWMVCKLKSQTKRDKMVITQHLQH